MEAGSPAGVMVPTSLPSWTAVEAPVQIAVWGSANRWVRVADVTMDVAYSVAQGLIASSGDERGFALLHVRGVPDVDVAVRGEKNQGPPSAVDPVEGWRASGDYANHKWVSRHWTPEYTFYGRWFAPGERIYFG
jgi:hypothetical protein